MNAGQLTLVGFCLWIVVSLAVCFGCALSPQTVAVQPAIDVRAEPIGRGRELALTVLDERSQKEFGARGGVYATTLITPRTDVAQGLRWALTERLTASGFVVSEGTPAPVALRVALRALTYSVARVPYGAGLLNEITVRAVVSAEASAKGERRSGQYQANSARRQVGYPPAEENEVLLNGVLARALRQLLQDRSILELLAR